MYKYILLIFIIGLNILNAQTSLSNDYSSTNSYSENGYIRNEEEARAAYSFALYYKEKALASGVRNEESINNLENAKVILKEVLKYIQDDDIYISLAETHEALGEIEESIKIYDSLVLNNPQNIDILIKAAERNIFFVGDFKKAKYYLENAYEIDRNYNDTLILLGFINFNDRDFQNAVYYFDKVNTTKPASKNYLQYYNFYYGMCNFYLSRFQNAIDRLNKLNYDSLSDKDRQDASFTVIKSYQALENYDEAYSKSLENPNASILSAYLSFMADKYNEELFSQINNSVNIPQVLSVIIEAKNNGYSNALNIIETDIDRAKIDLDIIQTYYKLVNEVGSKEEKIKAEMDIISFYLMLGNIDALPKHIENIINYDSKNEKLYTLYLQAALKFEEQNNKEAAKEMLYKYASLKKGNIAENELVSLVMTSSDIGEYDFAIKNIEKFEKEKDSYSYLKSYVYYLNNDFDNANNFLNKDLEFFKRNKNLNTNDYRLNIPYVTALSVSNINSIMEYANFKYSIDKDSAEGLNSLAWALIYLNIDIDKGISLAKDAVKIEPKSPHYIDTLGFGYYLKGNYDESLKLLLKAAFYADETSEAEIYSHLADVYYAKEDFNNALKYYRKSISSIYKDNSFDSKRIEERISSIENNKQ